MAPATVKHLVIKYCPMLTASELTSKALNDLADAHNEFFIAKEVDEADRVKKILGGFKNVHIQDWISCKRDCLLKLLYDDFIAEVHKNYLSANWKEHAHAKVLSCKMSTSDKFWDWCQQVCTLNIVLHRTTSYLDDAALHNQLEAALEENLYNYCLSEKINCITTLKDWIKHILKSIQSLQTTLSRACLNKVLLEETANLCNAKCPTLTNNSHNVNTAAFSSSSLQYCFLLDPEKQKLLIFYNECFKCCHFYQNHRGADCPNGFPDGAKYKKITAQCDAAGNPRCKAENSARMSSRSAQPAQSTQSSKASKGKAIAAITNGAEANDSSDDK
ncbi:hypothetical protein CPB84DRAFT_1694756 [Gymnopilus junonius]|uniref:Uncharacterized protein n=1 Tax=Gymnopilus junonius TaxID=109634 RepID=A0A9P5N8J5_GYMJU|nr:hypothetical protein CPB84DRAFT_1694756 [Gymnopilus junonius]